MSPESSMTDSLIRKADTEGEDGHMTPEAEIGVTHVQAKDHQELLKNTKN